LRTFQAFQPLERIERHFKDYKSQIENRLPGIGQPANRIRAIRCKAMGAGREAGRAKAPLDFENLSKKNSCVVSSGKKQISPLRPPRKSLEKFSWCPPLEKILPTLLCKAYLS